MTFHLFQAFGVELEYMVVDRDSLAVRPVVDALLRDLASLPGAAVESAESEGWPDEVSLGPVTVGNELCAHVLELKVTEPAPSLDRLDDAFAASIARLTPVLDRHGVGLLPSGMHPLMNPDREMRLWPHGNSEVYAAFNRIFDCRGHGWANLQACHLNLPFAGADDPEGEFARLHAAVRVLLPLMPALAASTPFMEGRATGMLDNRLEVYRTNSRRIPQAAGLVIPERAYTRADYQRVILDEIYHAYAPHDPAGVLRHEWANSRGAIARFGRSTIEVRVLDVQECPRADLAVVSAVSEVIRALAERRLGNLAALKAWAVEPLHAILLDVIRHADHASISLAPYVRDLGYAGPLPAPAPQVWIGLVDRALQGRRPAWYDDFRLITDRGCLARRILHAAGSSPTPESITAVYRRLARCLASNTFFTP
jgi:hypothetical protein